MSCTKAHHLARLKQSGWGYTSGLYKKNPPIYYKLSRGSQPRNRGPSHALVIWLYNYQNMPCYNTRGSALSAWKPNPSESHLKSTLWVCFMGLMDMGLGKRAQRRKWKRWRMKLQGMGQGIWRSLRIQGVGRVGTRNQVRRRKGKWRKKRGGKGKKRGERKERWRGRSNVVDTLGRIVWVTPIRLPGSSMHKEDSDYGPFSQADPWRRYRREDGECWGPGVTGGQQSHSSRKGVKGLKGG